MKHLSADTAALMAQFSNVIVAAHGGTATFKAADFLNEPRKASRKMDAKELRAMAVLAFGPPPSSNQ